MTPSELLAAAARSDPARPLVTSYDEDRGERTELSVATTVNWVAKLGNAFTDEWGLEPGDEVAVDLPPHWAGFVVVLGIWSAGGEVVDAAAAGAGFSARTSDAAALTDRELLLTLAPMGMDLSGLVAGWPDQPATVAPPGGAAAAAEAEALRLPADGRLLSALPFDRRVAAVHTVAGPLSAAGSLIVVRGEPGPERLAEIAAAERATHTAGCDVADLPRLA
jgi:hypothetical protein